MRFIGKIGWSGMKLSRESEPGTKIMSWGTLKCSAELRGAAESVTIVLGFVTKLLLQHVVKWSNSDINAFKSFSKECTTLLKYIWWATSPNGSLLRCSSICDASNSYEGLGVLPKVVYPFTVCVETCQVNCTCYTDRHLRTISSNDETPTQWEIMKEYKHLEILVCYRCQSGDMPEWSKHKWCST